MQTIKALATVTRTTRESRELPLVTVAALHDPDTCGEMLGALLDAGVTHSEHEIAVLACDVPLGCSARKPTGETHYTRARSETWVYKTLGIAGEQRVLVTTGDGGVSLWEPDKVVVVKLRDVAESWFLTELHDAQK